MKKKKKVVKLSRTKVENQLCEDVKQIYSFLQHAWTSIVVLPVFYEKKLNTSMDSFMENLKADILEKFGPIEDWFEKPRKPNTKGRR